MTSKSADVLEWLLRGNDLGWMIDMYSPRDRAIPLLLEQLTRLTDAFQKRFKYSVSFASE